MVLCKYTQFNASSEHWTFTCGNISDVMGSYLMEKEMNGDRFYFNLKEKHNFLFNIPAKIIMFVNGL